MKNKLRIAVVLFVGLAALVLLSVVLWLSVISKSSDGCKNYTVEMTEDVTFQPDSLTIYVCDTVTWHNGSQMPHTATADPNAITNNPALSALISLPPDAKPWSSGHIGPGQSNGEFWSYTFQTTGEYHYVCDPHGRFGMIGTIIVNP